MVWQQVLFIGFVWGLLGNLICMWEGWCCYIGLMVTYFSAGVGGYFSVGVGGCGRLKLYDRSQGPRRHGQTPAIPCRWKSPPIGSLGFQTFAWPGPGCLCTAHRPKWNHQICRETDGARDHVKQNMPDLKWQISYLLPHILNLGKKEGKKAFCERPGDSGGEGSMRERSIEGEYDHSTLYMCMKI